MTVKYLDAKKIQGQYNVFTPWDITDSAYASKSFSVSSYFAELGGIAFKTDGTKMYVSDYTADTVSEFTLDTAWDITTATYVAQHSFTSTDNALTGVFFKSDGTKIFVVGLQNDTVYEFPLSSAWDISSVGSLTDSHSISSQESNPYQLFFKPDGLTMYVIGGSNNVNQYTLNSAWDLSGTVTHYKTFSVSSQDSAMIGLQFSSDGTKMFTAGYTNDKLYQYTLGTAWDLNGTVTYDSDATFTFTESETHPCGIFFNSNGGEFFALGTGQDTVYQYHTKRADDKATLVIDGKSCFFDGTDDYVTAPATILSGIGTGIFSMAMWIRKTADSNALIRYTAGNYWEIHVNGSGKMEYSSNTNRAGNTVLSDATWYHLVVERDGSDIISMWIDGVAQTMSDATADTVSFSGDIKIGGAGTWTGYIDDMVITSDLLTASEISDLAGGKIVAQVNPDNQTVHYTFQSDFTDSSGNARNGTATGAVAGSTTSPPAYTYSNLPENTIFNETDTYSQWWLQDGEWIMTPTWHDTFVSNKGWTQVGSQVIDEWATTNLVQYTNARTDWIWKLLPIPIQGGKDWAVRVKWTHTSTSATGGQYALLYLSNSASDPESSGVKSLGVHFAPYADSIRVRTNDEGTKTYGTGSGGSYEGTDNWIHLYRSGTTLYIQLYADATFTTTRGSLVSIAIPDNIKDIDLTYFSFGADSEDEGTFTGSMDNLEIYNGVAL